MSLISCSDPAMVDAVMCTMLLGSQAADGHGCERDEIASLAHIAREPVERAKPEEPIGEAEVEVDPRDSAEECESFSARRALGEDDREHTATLNLLD